MAQTKKSRLQQLKSNTEYLSEAINLIKKKIDEVKEYMDTNDWKNKSNQKEREDEFKFQSGLVDNYISWSTQYAELSGVVALAEESIKENEQAKELRKGSFESPFASHLKNGDLEDDEDDESDSKNNVEYYED